MSFLLTKSILIPFFVAIAVIRYLPNLLDANLYAEDGNVFLNNYISSGISSINDLFNGYPIVGLYILIGAASTLHSISFLPGFTVPTFIALISFIYWGLFSYSPIYLLKEILSKRNRVLLAFSILLIPLGSWDYAILGTIGNLKFSFLPLSFFTALFLSGNREIAKKEFSLIILLFAICITTNPLSILSFSVLIPRLNKAISDRNWFYVSSVCALFLAALWPILSFFSHRAPQPGYLDAPYKIEKSIEIFAGQTILYAGFHSVYMYLNDYFAFALATLLILFVILFTKKSNYFSIVAISMALIGSGVFVLERPGISDFFYGYTTSSPSQFFYAQNILATTAIFITCQSFYSSNKTKGRAKLIALLPVIVFISQIFPTTPIGTFGHNPPMQNQVASAIESSKLTCRQVSPVIEVNIYPYEPWVFKTTKNYWC